MDFSDAERRGFINAFRDFWHIHGGDDRSDEERVQAAESLLRGCQEHFRAAVTRVARINGAVPVDKKEAFTERALGLLHCATSDDFQLRANLIIRDFPKLSSWMDSGMVDASFTCFYALQVRKEDGNRIMEWTTQHDKCSRGNERQDLQGLWTRSSISRGDERTLCLCASF